VLIISPVCFHDKSGLAGEKTINYYFSRFSSDPDFDPALVFTGDIYNNYYKMLEQYPRMNIFTAFKDKSIEQRIYDYSRFHWMYPLFKKIFPTYYITDGFLKERLRICLKKIKSSGYKPDVIIVEMAHLIFQVETIKIFFPDSYIVASCHDITSQSVERFKIKRIMSKWYIAKFIEIERRRLAEYNLIVVHNSKDKILAKSLMHNLNKNIISINPFISQIKYNSHSLKDGISFWGAMGRHENQEAVIWFLKNVWINLDQYYHGKLKFYIIGGGCTSRFKSLVDKYPNTIITGFVDDPSEHFSKAYAMIVPLHKGAGIKIKCLEAMLAGMPLITNTIGIEGINAIKDRDYLHAESENEFKEKVIECINSQELRDTLGKNAKLFIQQNFNLEESYQNYKKTLLSQVE
jgi:glycosyltransferase involved in cell wall biosynthesis